MLGYEINFRPHDLCGAGVVATPFVATRECPLVFMAQEITT
jgi:hypothetical protein